jgi:hypothetical protein
MNELVAKALALLPTSGEILFDAYKAQLNSAMPDKAKDVFTHILKHDLVGKVVKYDTNKQVQVYLSRKVS